MMPQSDENAFDLQDIFIGREQQLDAFDHYLQRWKSLMRRSPTEKPVLTPPSLNNKIQGLVVLIYGDGGFGKSSLLKCYYEMASKAEQGLTTITVDWEFVIGGNQRNIKVFSEPYIEIYEYFNVMRSQLAIALGVKRPEEFSEYQKAARDVQEANIQASSVLDGLPKDDRFADLRKMSIDGVVKLICAVDPTPVTKWLDTDVVKQGLNEGIKIGSDQLQHITAKLRARLGQKMSALLDPAVTLGLSLGRDLARFARNQPILIFFDTYEEIDEGDSLLRIVMGAAGVRVGWVLAGRGNLWAGREQRQRRMEIEYGYKDIVLTDRGLGIDFNAESIGPFTLREIKEYFDRLCKKTRQNVPLPFITETNAAQILELTQGVPLAVKIAAGLYLETADIQFITERAEAENDVIDIMVQRYLLHTRTKPDDMAKLYGLALLRRAYETESIAAALGLSSDQARTQYQAELSRLHRRYSFIFTAKNKPSLHQEVRHFLRLWLREQRDIPEIRDINERLQEIQKQALKRLEEKRQYKSLKERVRDEEWLGLYLDLIEQTLWLDAFEGVRYLLPLMIAVRSYGSLYSFDWFDVNFVSKATYKPDTVEDIFTLGEFFQPVMNAISREWWQWAIQSKEYTFGVKPERRATAMEKLAELVGQRKWIWFLPLPDYTSEVEALQWSQIGDLYRYVDEGRAVQWYEKALTRLENEEALKQTLAETYFAIARTHYSEKHYAKMIQPLDRAIQILPTYKMAYYERGVAYNWLRRYDQALEDYNRVLELDPQDASAYYERGVAYNWLRRYDQALEDLNKALELDPQDAASYRNRGNVYSLLRRYDQALENYNRAMELDPQNASTYRDRGNIYRWLRRYDQALEDLNKALELDPQDARTYRNRGSVYSWLRRYDQALEDLNKALELDPQDAASYRNRGSAYSLLRRYDQALEDLNKALELDPQDDFAYRDRGIILLGLRKKEQAYVDFNHASELNPMDIEPLWIHCWGHMSKHEKDEKTIKQLEELVEQSSSHKYVTDRDIEYVCQGVAMGLRGDLEAGLDMLEKITSQQPFLVYSTQFWKGMFNAYHSRNPEIAMKMILDAIDGGMPSILLTPLHWLERDKQEFFETYALPVLKAHNV